MITNIIITIAIVLMAFAITLMSIRVKVTEEAVEEIDIDKLTARIDQMDKDLDKCELKMNENPVDDKSDEIEEIHKKMKEITDDIARLDALTNRDHLDLVDIRERYVLWREPK